MRSLENNILIHIGAFLFFGLVGVLLFFPPLFDGTGALQWDAREVHLANLIFSSAVWQDGFSPLWAPYIFNGFPQIADPQAALFYPANLAVWPFAVFSQKIIFWQLALHYALAGFFMFLLARHMSGSFWGSILAGLAYELSGFMVGHASHLGMQNTAAWLPLVFWLFLISLERQNWRLAVWAGGAGGVMILAGHFQMAVFSLFAIGFYFIFHFTCEWVTKKIFPAHLIFLFLIFAVVTFLISSVQLVPTFELSGLSQRAAISLELAQTESLNPDSLWSVILHNYNNVSEGDYTGPWDRTQNDLFLGKTVVVLALLGLALTFLKSRWPPPARLASFFSVTIGAVAIFYSLGKYGFLHQYFYLTPLFSKMRAPGNMMLIFDLAVIILAALGLSWLENKIGRRFRFFVSLAVVLLTLELLPGALSSELLYARHDPGKTFEKSWIVSNTEYEYTRLSPGNQFRLYRVPELERNVAQVARIYDAGGYNPLALKRQGEYEDAMAVNPLLADLAGVKYLPCEYIPSRAAQLKKVGNLCINESYSPRAFLTDKYQVAPNVKEAIDLLKNLNSRETLILEERPIEAASLSGGPVTGEVKMEQISDPNRVELTVNASQPALLFVGQTFYPGWRAWIDGRPAKIMRADYLFQAVAVPEGEHQVVLRFDSFSLKLGVFLSMMGVIAVLAAGLFLLRDFLKKRRVAKISH